MSTRMAMRLRPVALEVMRRKPQGGATNWLLFATIICLGWMVLANDGQIQSLGQLIDVPRLPTGAFVVGFLLMRVLNPYDRWSSMKEVDGGLAQNLVAVLKMAAVAVIAVLSLALITMGAWLQYEPLAQFVSLSAGIKMVNRLEMLQTFAAGIVIVWMIDSLLMALATEGHAMTHRVVMFTGRHARRFILGVANMIAAYTERRREARRLALMRREADIALAKERQKAKVVQQQRSMAEEVQGYAAQATSPSLAGKVLVPTANTGLTRLEQIRERQAAEEG